VGTWALLSVAQQRRAGNAEAEGRADCQSSACSIAGRGGDHLALLRWHAPRGHAGGGWTRRWPRCLHVLRDEATRRDSLSATTRAQRTTGGATTTTGRRGAVSELTSARRADPLSPVGSAVVAFAHERAGAPRLAVEVALRAVALHPDRYLGYWRLGLAYLRLGKTAEAV